MKVKVATVLPHKNGRHVPHLAGDVVPLAKLSEAVVRAVNADDRLLAAVLERA